jgi:hypothetical protein
MPPPNSVLEFGNVITGRLAHGRPAVAPTSSALSLYFVVFISTTILQRFAVPAAGSVAGIGFLVSFCAFLTALYTQRLSVSIGRLILYLMMACSVLSTIFTKYNTFSMLSLFMLLTMYIPFIGCMVISRRSYGIILNSFQKIMFFCGACGIAQFVTQLFFGAQAMFPFDKILPETFFIPGFNLQIPIGSNGTLLKSNGLFFLEPSHFSQFISFAIAIEVLYFRRLIFISLFSVSYLVSFSGTGAILIGFAYFLMFFRDRHFFRLLLGVLTIGVVLFLLRDVPPFSVFLARTAEFANPLSSGSMRFLSPYWFVGDVLAGDVLAILFGFGPGQVTEVGNFVDYAVQDSSWMKLVVEYGLLGAVPFFVFYTYSLFRLSPDRILSCLCLLQFLFLGGYLNSFYIQFFHMALVIWPQIDETQTRR